MSLRTSLWGYFFDMAIAMRAKYWKLLVSVAFLYFFCLGIYTHKRIEVWKDSDTLKRELRDLVSSIVID